MSGGLLMLWLMRLPCLPVELGEPPPPSAPSPTRPLPGPAPLMPPPARLSAPPPPMPAPLAMRESAHYRVDYGVLSIGEIQLSVDGPLPGAAAGPAPARGETLVRAAGYGQGAIFGLGRLENRIEAEFDLRSLSSRRWTSARLADGQSIRDFAEQPQQGQIEMRRERAGAPVDSRRATFPGPALDPVSFLLRLRVAPPAPGGSQVLQVLDGQALWRVTISNTSPPPTADGGPPRIRLEGRAEPIFYDGRSDPGERSLREFALWLSDDAARVPLRLEMPIGIGDLVVALVDVDRRPLIR
jgi:Protein of unknown function (DUF3108)